VKSAIEGQVSWVQVPDVNLIDAALKHLYTQNVSSVLVEGGAKLLQSFIKAGLWDEARVIHAPVTLGSGLPAPRLGRAAANSYAYGVDRIYQYLAK
jgi:diaminohydroxyphosphoribosylaminopyrimidine deaminase/5-amino-6-(5-phosphoribosylamino)uracil reductase